MDNSARLLLLKIIKFNGDITPLIKLGYEYTQIVGFMQAELKDGNIQQINGVWSISQKGNIAIANLSRSRNGGSDSWIEPEIASKIKPIDKDSIFLPNKNELSF